MNDHPTLFISYRRADGADLARYIHEKLTQIGVDVFFDVETLEGGDRFAGVIEHEISNRTFFLVILKPQTLESEWVRREISLAIQHGKRVIPLVTGDFDFYENLPDELQELGAYNAIKYDFTNPEPAFKRLQRVIVPEFEQRAEPSSRIGRKSSSHVQPTSIQRIIPMVLIATGLFLGLLMILLLRSVFSPPGDTITTFNVTGQNATVLNQSTVETLIINTGDSDVEKERKSRERADAMVAEVMQYARNLDARFGYVDRFFVDDGFNDALDEVRATGMPAVAEIIGSQYQEMISHVDVQSLRQQFNSSPLPLNPNPSFQSLAAQSTVSPYKVQFMYDSLTEAHAEAENFFEALGDANQISGTGSGEWVKLAAETLENDMAIAYYSILDVLIDLKEEQPNTQVLFNNVTHLTPQNVPSSSALLALQTEASVEALTLYSARAALLDEFTISRDNALEDYRAVLQSELIIKENDSWETVIGKAITLRQFGRIPEAIAAFQQYGEMFAESDPDAPAYSEIAQQFTRQISTLGTEGGVYLFAILEDSPAAQNGFMKGDIIIAFDDEPVRMNEDLMRLLDESHAGDTVEIAFLRRNEEGFLIEYRVPVTLGERENDSSGAFFGAGYMRV